MKTQDFRSQFREHVKGFYKSGPSYGEPYGDGSMLKKVEFPCAEWIRPAGRISLLFHPVVAPVFAGLASVMLFHGYLFREISGGSYNPRNITGAPRAKIHEQVRQQYPLATSIHAHGGAVDLNPSKNPYGSYKTDMPRAFVKDVQAIRLVGGAPALVWGYSFKDPMHWQATGGPNRSAYVRGVDTATVVGLAAYLEWLGVESGDEMIVRVGARGEWMKPIQRALNEVRTHNNLNVAALTEPFDGVFGPKTQAIVKAYQDSSGLRAQGIEYGSIDWLTGLELAEFMRSDD